MTEQTEQHRDAELDRLNRAAKLSHSLESITAMLSRKLWETDDYDDMKDHGFFMAAIDACNAAASELHTLIVEQPPR